MYETGTFWLPKYSRRASNEPKVEAATPTPRFSNLIFFLMFSNSASQTAIASSTYSSLLQTKSGVPATASSRPVAASLTPLAA